MPLSRVKSVTASLSRACAAAADSKSVRAAEIAVSRNMGGPLVEKRPALGTRSEDTIKAGYGFVRMREDDRCCQGKIVRAGGGAEGVRAPARCQRASSAMASRDWLR